MLSLRIILLGLFLTADVVLSCGSSASDAEFIENPVFQMQISPPVGWTYFPSQPSVANQAIWYFVGQANDTLTAKNRADAEITAAMIAAIAAANLPTQGVTVSNDYQPISVENPQTTTPTGPVYGKVEGGTLTATAQGTTENTGLKFIPYTHQLRVNVNNVATTRFYWNIVQNTFLQKMSMDYHAKFSGAVQISKV